MPVEIGNALVVMAVLGIFLGLTVVMVVLGSREEEPDPNGAEAYALEQLDAKELDAKDLDVDQLDDEEFNDLWEEEDEKE